MQKTQFGGLLNELWRDLQQPAVLWQVAVLALCLGIFVAVPLIFAVAFIVFIWGVFKFFILGGGNEEQREGGRGRQ